MKYESIGHFKATYVSGIVFLIIMQIIDMGMSYFLFSGGYGFIELNPIMSGVVDNFVPFLVAKICGVVSVVVLGELMRRYGKVSLAHSIIWVTAGFSACVVWSNMMAVLMLLGSI